MTELDALTEQWLRDVMAAGFVPGPRARSRVALRDLMQEMAAAIRAEPFSPTPGTGIGRELVDLRMQKPQVLGATVRLFADRLPDLLDGDADENRTRVLLVLESLTTGFVTALREVSVSAAEEMNRTEKLHWKGRQRELFDRYRRAVLHDPRSGLPNRASLRDHLRTTITAAGCRDRAGLCLLSIDRFADLDDALGHDRGDRLLQAVGGRLQTVAEDRHYLAHLGEDQFALVVTGTTGTEQVLKLADRARAALDARPLLLVDDLQLMVTVTAGVVEAPVAGTDPETWIRDAHLALGTARTERRDHAVVDPDRARADLHRHRIAATLPAALERGEFFPAYQPLYRLADRTVTGVEALARWRTPDGTVHGPDQFIALAEQTGLIKALGRSLLTQACRQGAAWHHQGHDLLISVNLSPLQLDDPSLVGDVADIVHRSGLPLHLLQLEITESAAVVDRHDTLRRLHDLGVTLAIDDFGTGWSSLGSLSRLPISTVKLAAELVADPASPIPRHVIRLCHDLGITVLAEGIESAAQERWLHSLGCDDGQGYLFGRPTSPRDVTALL
ncbi:putative bifunctional diguanylate cyclase/phosphodiesterase [Actinoplanes rectilineatus]|uniref:putative bifunctional diguanylate cyclase/phosphodiesterase n=1 Tax=Actinoplanes rectilineatus TaxID=113571 RepID=UPI0005F294BD|nr:GGDEF domain-containing phosphodiesterase [Actinoplanes rectilineatus]